MKKLESILGSERYNSINTELSNNISTYRNSVMLKKTKNGNIENPVFLLHKDFPSIEIDDNGEYNWKPIQILDSLVTDIDNGKNIGDSILITDTEIFELYSAIISSDGYLLYKYAISLGEND